PGGLPPTQAATAARATDTTPASGRARAGAVPAAACSAIGAVPRAACAPAALRPGRPAAVAAGDRRGPSLAVPANRRAQGKPRRSRPADRGEGHGPGEAPATTCGNGTTAEERPGQDAGFCREGRPSSSVGHRSTPARTRCGPGETPGGRRGPESAGEPCPG